MSLQDKISSAKPNTFLTDGLTQEEVKQAVDEGRMSDTVKLIIEIQGYVEHIRNTGMGKKKSLEFIEKYIDGLKEEREFSQGLVNVSQGFSQGRK